MRPIQENTLDSLRQLVGISAVMQEEALKDDNLYKDMQPLQFVEEFCTVLFKGPRRCGHTTALLKLSRERFLNVALMILPDTTAIHHVHNMALDVLGYRYRNRLMLVKGAHRLNQRFVFNPGTIDAILVDCASYWDSTQLKDIILDTFHLCKGKLDKEEPFFYIMVQ